MNEMDRNAAAYFSIEIELVKAWWQRLRRPRSQPWRSRRTKTVDCRTPAIRRQEHSAIRRIGSAKPLTRQPRRGLVPAHLMVTGGVVDVDDTLTKVRVQGRDEFASCDGCVEDLKTEPQACLAKWDN